MEYGVLDSYCRGGPLRGAGQWLVADHGVQGDDIKVKVWEYQIRLLV